MRFVHPSWLTVFADPIRLTILGLLHERDRASVRELAVEAHGSNRTLRRHLDALIAIGVVHEVEGERDGVRPGRPPSRFLLDPAARRDLGELFAILGRPLGP
jgi:predicted ArsR family transcriptional regulator